MFELKKAFLVLFVSTGAFAQIKNFRQITDQIYRSAAPARNIPYLGQAGFTHVLIFKNQTKNEVDTEIRDLQKIGILKANIYHVPFSWKETGALEEACEQVVTALGYLAQVEKSRSHKMLFHCTLGEDRTGALAGLYRMLYSGWSIDRAFQEEMCANGYEAGDKGKPLSIVNLVRSEVTPVFLAVASLIVQKKISFNYLNPKVCKGGDMNSPHVKSLLSQKSKYICN